MLLQNHIVLSQSFEKFDFLYLKYHKNEFFMTKTNLVIRDVVEILYTIMQILK